jgi:hypothetical protein
MLLYAAALALSVIRYRWYYDSVLRYLPIIIAYALLGELLGYLISEVDSFQIVYKEGFSNYNSLIFNIFDIVFYLYFFYVFSKTFQKQGHKKFVRYGTVLFLVASSIDPFFHDPILYPQYFAIVVGSIVLVGSGLLYLGELKTRKGKIPPQRNLMFWICVGLIGFHTLYPILMTTGLLNTELYLKLQLRRLLHIAIAFMYGSFIIGFVRMQGRLVNILGR